VVRSTNLLERLIKEVKRSTKVRDNVFPTADSVLKVIYLAVERYAEEEARTRFACRYP